MSLSAQSPFDEQVASGGFPPNCVTVPHRAPFFLPHQLLGLCPNLILRQSDITSAVRSRLSGSLPTDGTKSLVCSENQKGSGLWLIAGRAVPAFAH